MKLIINKKSTVENVKKIFTNYYPYLRIELYKRSFNENQTITKKEPLSFNVQLNDVSHTAGENIISISNDVTVAELENRFENIGLIAGILRKSGNVWIEASLTNNWTLQQQNAAAEEISRSFNKTKINDSNSL
jgi:hypothetical protein